MIKFRVWTGKKMRYPEQVIIFSDGDYSYLAPGKDCGMIGEQWCEGKALMQFTDQKDKAGKEIYEGDIIQAEHTNFHDLNEGEIVPEYVPWIGVVIKNNGRYIIETKTDYSPGLSNIRITSIKVIGNIYENPEKKLDKFSVKKNREEA